MSEAQLAKTLTLQLSPNPAMEFMLIPPGKFMMGSLEDAPAHPVEIAAAYYLGKFPVTQAQWLAVMGSNPSHFAGSGDQPVETVTWEECFAFCQRVSILTGYQASLPSEAEWEYACRAGSHSAYSFGEGGEKLGDYGWYRNNSGGMSHPVGLKLPNAWGLYDMHGGIDEYCQDTWHANYTGAPIDGQAWLEHGEQELRVLRGGSWYDLAEHCSSPHRNYYRTGVPAEDHGLRLKVKPRLTEER